MAYIQHQNHQFFVIYIKNDSIIPDAESIALNTHQFFDIA